VPRRPEAPEMRREQCLRDDRNIVETGNALAVDAMAGTYGNACGYRPDGGCERSHDKVVQYVDRLVAGDDQYRSTLVVWSFQEPDIAL